jgi:hypothetical protein
MTAHQRTYRSRIPKIAAVACSLVLVAGYIHFQATGRFIPGAHREQPALSSEPAKAEHTAPQQQAEAPQQPVQKLFPGSKEAPMFPSSKIGIISVEPPAGLTEFFGGSKSSEIFDASDVPTESEVPSSQPQAIED